MWAGVPLCFTERNKKTVLKDATCILFWDRFQMSLTQYQFESKFDLCFKCKINVNSYARYTSTDQSSAAGQESSKNLKPEELWTLTAAITAWLRLKDWKEEMEKFCVQLCLTIKSDHVTVKMPGVT